MTNATLQWAINALTNRDYQVQTNIPDIIQDTPWSVVYRIATNKGYVFLKQVPQALLLETTVIQVLYNDFQANVPFVIESSNEHNCFLMADAGIRLYDYFKIEFHANIVTQTMQSYAQLQIKTLNNIQQILKLGVPDWRVEKLPKLYQVFIAQEDLLLEDGLTQNELAKLPVLQPKLITLCEHLSQFKIKDTFAHADFHDKNILIIPETRKTTVIDLGEVVITHPFFSLHNFLHRIKENFSLPINMQQELLHVSLEPWLEFESMDGLLKIISIINQCWPIHSVLGEYRLMMSVNPADFKKLHRQGRLANNLRHWLRVCYDT